jgi:MFS family permease
VSPISSDPDAPDPVTVLPDTEGAARVGPEGAAATRPQARPTTRSDLETEWLRPLILQLSIAALSVTAVNGLRPMVTYRAIDLGAGPLEIGLVASSFSILPALTAILIGRWVDRFGEVPFLIGAMAMIALGSSIGAVADSLPILALGHAITGFGQVTGLVAGQAMIANYGPRQRREERFGWYSTVASLGQLIGPSLGAALIALGTTWTEPPGAPAGNRQLPIFLFGAASGTTAALLALRLPRRREWTGRTNEPAQVSVAHAATRVLRRPGMLAAMLVSITVISSVDVLVAYLPAFGDAVGLSVETVALLLSLRALASLVSRIFMTRLIDLLGRERLLALSMVVAGLALALLPVLAVPPVLAVLMVAAGLGLGLGQPMTIAWVANRSPRAERGLALGVRLTGNRVALLVVPTVMGAIAGAAGIAAIWMVLAACLLVGSIVAVRTPFDALVEAPRGERS